MYVLSNNAPLASQQIVCMVLCSLIFILQIYCFYFIIIIIILASIVQVNFRKYAENIHWLTLNLAKHFRRHTCFTCERQSGNIILASTSGANLTGGEPTRNNLFCKQTFQTTIGKDNTYRPTIPVVLYNTCHTHLINNRTNMNKLVKKL